MKYLNENAVEYERKISLAKELIDRISFHLKYIFRKYLNVTVINIRGVKLKVDNPSITEKIKNNIYKEFYEAYERSILEQTLETNDVVLDVGGGLGYIAAVCARRVQRVEVIEANPSLIPIIEETLRINGVSAQVHNGVLAENDGVTNFYVAPHFWASSITPISDALTTQVPTIACRTFMNRLRPSYLVMDIEGGEIALIPSLPLESIQKICIEIHPSIVGQQAVDEMVKSIVERGFALNSQVSRRYQLFFRREQ